MRSQKSKSISTGLQQQQQQHLHFNQNSYSFMSGMVSPRRENVTTQNLQQSSPSNYFNNTNGVNDISAIQKNGATSP
jgi:hypothetical protein